MRNKSVSTINGSTAFRLSFSFAHTVSVFFMGLFSLFLFFMPEPHTHTQNCPRKIDFMDVEMAIGDFVVFSMHFSMPSFFVCRPNCGKTLPFFQAKINNFNATFDIFCLLASTFSRFTLQPRTA